MSDELKPGDIIIDRDGDWVMYVSSEGGEDKWIRVGNGRGHPNGHIWTVREDEDIVFYNKATRTNTGINLYDVIDKLAQEVSDGN